jgi:hypothetical protein
VEGDGGETVGDGDEKVGDGTMVLITVIEREREGREERVVHTFSVCFCGGVVHVPVAKVDCAFRLMKRKREREREDEEEEERRSVKEREGSSSSFAYR